MPAEVPRWYTADGTGALMPIYSFMSRLILGGPSLHWIFVVLFVLEMEGLSCQCAREGTCPVQ